MKIFYENETEAIFPFDAEEIVALVADAVLKEEKCPYNVQINVLVTDNPGIREYNRQYRNIDRETDVLSFPNVDYEAPSDFSEIAKHDADYLDPETGELVLGDIILSADKVFEQSENYGHSVKREFAFLVSHSMLHLCGYDHMEEAERMLMEEKQRMILSRVQITRED
ncbi:MAG: rRNA maturation RNase YbeY [Lachnospiraceae bacterium]